MQEQREPNSSTTPSGQEQADSPTASPPNRDGRSFDGPAHTPARSLMVHFGRWVGDDVEELLAEVHRTRGKSSF
jgi:hypothetical protein